MAAGVRGRTVPQPCWLSQLFAHLSARPLQVVGEMLDWPGVPAVQAWPEHSSPPPLHTQALR